MLPVIPVGTRRRARAGYRDDDLLAQTGDRLRQLVQQGYHSEDITVVSYRGLGKSPPSQLDAVSELRIKKFTGTHDVTGEQFICPGELRYETAFRFKGHQVPVVLFTEIDLDEFDETTRRRLNLWNDACVAVP